MFPSPAVLEEPSTTILVTLSPARLSARLGIPYASGTGRAGIAGGVLFELAAAEQGVDIAWRADGGLKPVFGHNRIERDRRPDHVEIGLGREHKAFGTITRRAGAKLVGERPRLFDIFARGNA